MLAGINRAFLISGDPKLRDTAQEIIEEADLNDRAANSIEQLAANF